MATIVRTSAAGMDYALYGDKSHIVASYIQEQLAHMPAFASSYGQSIQSSIQDSYNYLTNSAIKHNIMQTLHQVNIDLGESVICELRTFEELQNANLTMQRWLMTDPFMRQLYLDQNIAGYDGTYINVSENRIGDRDYNYQLAMSGVPVELEDGSVRVRFYHAEDELLEGDRKLNHHEKITIQRTWANARFIAQEMGFDFTSRSEVPTKINFE